MENEPALITFNVNQVWKGPDVQKITVNSFLDGNYGGYPFQVNETYLIYAWGNDNQLYTGSCGLTLKIEEASDHIPILDLEVEKAKGNIVPINLSVNAPDLVVVKKGESIQIPITATMHKSVDPNVKMAIVADGQEEVFYTTGQVILPDGFSTLRTGSMSWGDTSGEYIHLTIFFELTPSFDVSPGNYTLAAALSDQNSSVSEYFKANVLNNLKVGFPKTNVTEIYHLKGNYYTPDRELEYQDFKIPYKISNGTIKEIKVNQLNEWLAVNIENTADGVIEIDIPRNLFDQKFNSIGDWVDDSFIVLIDGKESNFTEFKTPCFRNLLIKFPEKAEEIEIAGMNVLMGPEPFASDVSPIYLVTNSKNYTNGDTITIFGCTSLNIDEEQMVFNIVDPEGRNLKSETIKPNLDGTFLYKLDTENKFVIDGDYTIQATYDGSTYTRLVTVPEFTFAFLVLTMSIIGLIFLVHKVNPK